MTPSLDLFPLLALGARAQGLPAQYDRLRRRFSTLHSWDDVVVQADQHGLEPLLYFHLRAAGIAMPSHVERQLQARTMQHAHANHSRAKALTEILKAFHCAGIEVLVLKGAALAHLIYPRPGLRVMRDLDILVEEHEADRAQTVLARIGFSAPWYADDLPRNFKHLPMARRRVDGTLVTVEVHRQLYFRPSFPGGRKESDDWETLWGSRLPFLVEDTNAYTLGRAHMLTHVYHHMCEDAFLSHLRLINWADLVSLAEHYAEEIDWAQIAPRIRTALKMIHPLTPLADNLIRAAAITPEEESPQEIRLKHFWQYRGWPSIAVARESCFRIPGILRRSFFPPSWWLRFYYGLSRAQVPLRGRVGLHPLHLLFRFSQAIRARVLKNAQ